MLLLVRSLFYTPHAVFIRKEFLLHTSGHLLSEEILLHSSSWFYWGVCLTHFEVILVSSFCYTPRAGFCEEFLLHSSSRF